MLLFCYKLLVKVGTLGGVLVFCLWCYEVLVEVVTGDGCECYDGTEDGYGDEESCVWLFVEENEDDSADDECDECCADADDKGDNRD